MPAPVPEPNPQPGRPVPAAPALAWLWLVTLALFAIRVTGPTNLLDNDQERPAAYVMDAVLHGHWWCQTDWTGDIMSKPPLFTWIAALATVPVGHANLVSLYFPCLIAVLLTVGLIHGFGRSPFGATAAFLAGLMYLASPSGVKHIALARTDAVFAATIALTAFLGYRAWTEGRSWAGFWVAAALATLAKGPLGIVLGAMGLLAALWERWDLRRAPDESRCRASSGESGARRSRTRPLAGHLIGLVLFCLITVGWFWLAYRQSGQAFIDKVIGRELVGHLVGEKHGTFGAGFVKAPLYWLSRFLPWSLLAVWGLWRVVRHPSTVAVERRFERFLFCWIAGGLLVFALATHQRGDLPLPLNAPAALLAGRELRRGLKRWKQATVIRRSLAGVTAALALYTVYLHTLFAGTWVVRHSEQLESFARELARAKELPPLLHVDSPYALQFHLNTMDRAVDYETAATRLDSDGPIAVAVCNAARLDGLLGETTDLHEWGRAPASQEGSVVFVLSNREK